MEYPALNPHITTKHTTIFIIFEKKIVCYRFVTDLICFTEFADQRSGAKLMQSKFPPITDNF